ncbi:MAG: hypothetical protein ACRD4M_02065 [Candidatus Acidiferrales bacterium]
MVAVPAVAQEAHQEAAQADMAGPATDQGPVREWPAAEAAQETAGDRVTRGQAAGVAAQEISDTHTAVLYLGQILVPAADQAVVPVEDREQASQSKAIMPRIRFQPFSATLL